MNKIDLTDSLEKIPVKIFPDSNDGSAFVAAQIAALIKQKESEGKNAADYTKFLDTNGLKGKRIGIEKKKYANQFLNQLLQKAKAKMK